MEGSIEVSRMKRSGRSVPVLVLLLVSVLPAPLVRADLQSSIHAILTDKLIARDQVGIEIVRLAPKAAQSEVIYELRATTPRVPASNLKLATTSAALNKLGSDFNFKT